MTTICNMSYKEIGPFAQTLFLGCSITNISQNLSWGTEASSCTVKLIKDTSSHPNDSNFNSVTDHISTIVNNSDPSNALVAGTTDTSKTAQKNLAIAEEKIESDRRINDIANTSRVANKDTGKKCWDPHNLNTNPVDWVGPDPGFVGDNSFLGGRLFGVAGVPCHARFDDLMFGGIINKWSSDSSIYTVEIEGPGNLLKGTKLIVNNYYGSISTVIGNTAGALPDGLPLAVPYADTTVNTYNGSIFQGNIPNVINIFGYLQSQGFSSVISSQQGINAAQIYDTLILLLNNSNGIQTNQFSPYGAIVGKSLIEYGTNGDVSIVAPQNTTLGYGSSNINLTQLGFLNHKLAIDGIYRPLFRLDISQVPRPDDNIYWPSSDASISDFLDFCCSGAGGDWNVLLLPDSASSPFTATIKVNFYNRNIQPPPKIIKNLVSNFSASDRVISYNSGEEYNSSDNVRKMIVGGNQERIFQVMSHTLSKYRNVKVFDPATGTFISVNSDLDKTFLENGNIRNVVRFPKLGSTRVFDSSLGGGLPYRTYGGAATAQVHNDFLSAEILGFSNTSITKGSYETTAPILKDGSLPELPLPSWYTGSTSYPIHYDLISPYFGRSTNGSVRKVYYDRKLGQLQVNVNLEDIQPFFPVYDNGTFSGSVTFYENEIRAAIAGFDSWISYVLEPIKLGMKTPTALLIYSFIRLKFGPSVANDLILQGVGLLKTQSKTSALPTMPHTGDSISPGNYVPYSDALRPAFEKLHQFVGSTLGSHYGKDFLVRLPSIKRRVDPNGVASYSYEISDSGWEEAGNFLDDTMQIGSVAATALSEENGKFGPILGYNASAEWDRTVFQNFNNGNFGLLPLSANGKSLLQMRSQFEQGTTDKWYFPLVHDLPPDQAVLMPHTSYLLPAGGALRPGFSMNNPTLTDSYGRSIPDGKKYKLYVKGGISDVVPENTTNKKILFANGAQYCVVSAPGKIQYVSSNSLEKTLYEDLYLASSRGFELPTDFNSNLQMNATSVSANKFLYLLAVLENTLNSSAIVPTQGLNSEQNVPISAKCAIPCFAAIPIRDNIAVYGPWISHPGLIRSTIFPDRSEAGANALTNNIVGGVELEIGDSYCPWEYGGMDNLDTAILTKLANNNRYQQVLEVGSITFAGIMLRNTNIGARFIDSNGPVINSIQIEMGDSGYRTTYHFRTYSRKLGFFNKEQSDNIQRFGKQALSNRKTIVENIRSQLSRAISLQDPAGDRAARLPKALSYSPVNVLVGASYPMVHKNSTMGDAYSQLNFNPSWHLRPLIPASISSNPKDMLRQQTVAQLYDSQELGKVIADRPADYASRSMMSLDGIVSPISFYPTPYGCTYAITFYPRSKCPYCKGRGTYQYQSYSNANSELADDSDSSDTTSTTITSSFATTSNATCMFCVLDANVDTLKKKSARPNEITPPFLIASGTDLQIITDRATAFQYNSCAVNTYTLNPMVMSAPGSDFSCYSNKQSSDRCGHSIDVVSFGNTSMSFSDGLRSCISNTINKNYNDYDTNLIAADPSNSQAFQNIRSFGLRGPLMLHSWGYDLEGYPVPNSSGEFKLDNQGGIVRDNQNNVVFKNQVLQADGSYSAPYKDNTFYKSWAQLPSTWPVGPIDLRWDDGAKVWTIGANYKPVWVVIETDLLNETPVRGAVVESSYDNSPLPSGLRKLVFVKDTIGMFSAPRGAALYCRYDSQNGFYEPIYNRPLVTTGTIDGASLATIYKAYTPSSISDDEVSSYSTSFENPLGLDTNINSVGLFTFLNGSWILQSIRT